MPNEIDWSQATPHVRHRKCPACGEELCRFQMNALQMPIEQYSMPLLQSVNNSIGWSIRPFGNQSLLELQYLVFISSCLHCSLVSTWDFSVEELEEILSAPQHPPFAQIAWMYAPPTLERNINAAPDWLKPQLQTLLNAVRPAPKDDKA